MCWPLVGGVRWFVGRRADVAGLIAMLHVVLLVIAGALLVLIVGLWLVGERGWPMRASTWKGLRAGGLRGLLNFKGLHMYVYGRWTNQYLNVFINHLLPRLGPRGRKWWRDRYHAKVLTPEHANAIVTLDRQIPLRDLEQIIPYPKARDLVLSGPPDVAVYECACRHARANPCQPTQVCMAIGQPFVDFTLEHHPHSSRRLTQTEAVDLLHAEHDRGHLHSAWFKDVCLGRFYAICNCCPCCCGGMEAVLKYDSPVLASSGYVAQIDETQCSSCGTCVDACPFGALSLDGVAVLDWEKCYGCGVCTSRCPSQAIALVRDERKGLPLDVRLLG